MPASDRIRSTREIGGGLREGAYSIFDGSPVDKQIAVWQPAGEIEALTEMPAPQNMKSKAESFLETAVDNSHFAAAPEWAYNIEWVTEHDDLLFDSGSPLFRLRMFPGKN